MNLIQEVLLVNIERLTFLFENIFFVAFNNKIKKLLKIITKRTDISELTYVKIKQVRKSQ